MVIVDDNDGVRNALARLLRERGWRVREAGSAEEAYALCRQAVPDVAVIDLEMPGAGGLALLAWIDRSWPWVWRVLVTSHHVARPPAERYLQKPVNPQELLDLLARLSGAGRPNIGRPAAVK